MIQYAIYAAFLAGGYLLRHFGINIPLMPGAPTPSVPSAPGPPVAPALDLKGFVKQLVLDEIAKLPALLSGTPQPAAPRTVAVPFTVQAGGHLVEVIPSGVKVMPMTAAPPASPTPAPAA